ncbi:MAG: DEAD/DEAH box helicase, partial [Chlamydiae bacterium]|nr:DEAD/DEAH box helicase [Chlamydiota bacterium]
LESTSPILLVMPTSLLFHWKKEFEKFLPSKEIYVHSGSLRLSNVEELEKKSIILTSYALLRIDQPILSKISFAATILDEAQYIKNPDSKVAEAACSLKSDFRIAMTGTPIENHWQDLWSIFYYLMPSLLDPRQEFLLRTSSGDAAYIRNCKKKVQPFLKRRKKESVDLQLPPKMQQIVWAQMTDIQQSVYEEFLKKTKQGLLKQVEKEGLGACRMQILEAILRLRQICCHPLLVDPSLEGDPKVMSGKYEQLFSDLQAVYEEGHKVLVYSQFTQMLGRMREDIEERGWKYVYLDGSVKNREELVETFQEDPETKIFLLSLKAGGVGLNLTAAEYVFFYDPWWNEAVENQAIDRAHRLGQQKKVIARRYVTAQSIEEKIMKIKEHKKSMSDTLFDDAMSMQALSLQEWYDLFTQ